MRWLGFSKTWNPGIDLFQWPALLSGRKRAIMTTTGQPAQDWKVAEI
jgi:hypothetical protein